MKPARAVLLDFGNTLVSEVASPEETDRAGAPDLEAHLARRLSEKTASKVVARFLRLRRERLEAARKTLVEESAVRSLAAAFEAARLHPPAPAEVEAALDAFFAKEEGGYRPVPRAAEALDGLRAAGFRLGLVSNNSYHSPIARTLERLDLRRRFDVLVSSSLFGFRKPDPRIFRAAADALGASPGDCVHVGDLPLVDVAGARAAGMRAVLARVVPALSSDFTSDGPEPDAVVTDLATLPDVARALLAR